MDDRELLEAAARAAGIEIQPHPNNRICQDLIFTSGRKNWNPLTDDGEALRLAVKLNMMVTPFTGITCVYRPSRDYGADEYHNGDPYAATRRAIVRAAAALAPLPLMKEAE